MAGIYISMLISMLILFILSRIVWINVIKDKELSLELHLPIIAIHLTESKTGSKAKQSKKRRNTKIYRRLMPPLLRLIKKSEIIIKKIEFPEKPGEISNATFTRPHKYQGAFFALCAYLRNKAQKLTVYDDAIHLSSDNSALQFHFTFKLRLFQLLFTGIAFVFNEMKEKFKEEIANVR